MHSLPWRSALAALALLSAAQAVAFPPDPVPEATRLAREGKHAEAAAAWGAYAKANRFDGRAWNNLGFELHGDKQYRPAIEAYQKAADLGYAPDMQYYNMACAKSLLGDADGAIAALRKAFEARFADQDTLEGDTDLDNIRKDPRFVELTGIGVPDESARDKRWAWDLGFLRRRMEQMHWDLYANISREDFAREIDSIIAAAPKLSDEQVRLRLQRLMARVGDGHTTVAAAPVGTDSIRRLPLDMYIFTDGLGILGAHKDVGQLAGSRVLKVGSLPVDEAIRAVRPYAAVDNEMGQLVHAARFLTVPSVLQGIGATSDASGADVTVRLADGREQTVRVSPVDMPTRHRPAFSAPDFVYAHEQAANRPLWLSKAGTTLWVEKFPEKKLVYFHFGAVQNSRGLSIADAARQALEPLESGECKYLVIDMRLNTGGNTGLVAPLIRGLIRCRAFDEPGRLFVIIGRHTFSAAQNTVNMIEINTNATFVGEPTGSRPNFVGESTSIVLPYSKYRVYCSSRYWQFQSSTDQRTWVQPQIAAEFSLDDYRTGRDPCMDAIERAITRPESKPTSTSMPSP